jgi:hypothetical protein
MPLTAARKRERKSADLVDRHHVSTLISGYPNSTVASREASRRRGGLCPSRPQTQWREGELVQEEEQTLHISFYFKNELLLMLEREDFTDIVIHGDHREEAATKDSDFINFVARKP